MTRALVFIPGRGAAHGEVDVYRDGEAVVCVGRVSARRNARVGRGLVEAEIDVSLRFPSVSAFDAEKAAAFERNPEKYALAVGTFKSLDDDARYAPEIPEELKQTLHARRMGTQRILAEARTSGIEIRLLGAGESEEDEEEVTP